MKTVLIGINAKYIHSNLAIRSIQKYVARQGHEIQIEEFTINQQVDFILSEIYKLQPDVLGFSCYIWNIEIVTKLLRAYKKIAPDTKIVLGGPEVSYGYIPLMEAEPSIDFLCFGEGEETMEWLLSALQMEKDFEGIEGLAYRTPMLQAGGQRMPLSMDALPFVYQEGLAGFEHRILYYETMRGCPFNCQYCLSSIEKGVRFRSLDLVKKELQFFLDQQVMQVKFVDRTFNCHKGHAMAIWRYLSEHDNGITNFHFEISADLLDSEMLLFLQGVRTGLFQFEIGVQSTYDETLAAIERKTDFDQLVQNVNSLRQGGNIHLHLDLIAGLPHEGYLTFKKSFYDVYALRPEQLQLGFLKVLKGSGIEKRSEEYGIRYRDYAPYEVLCTKALNYGELQKLKMLEEMVELFYNSDQFEGTLIYLEQFYETAFELYEAMAMTWEHLEYHKVNQSREGILTFLKCFGETVPGIDQELLTALLLFDLCLLEKIKKTPSWMERKETLSEAEIAFFKNEGNISKYLPELSAYASKQISRMAHLETFSYDLTRFKETMGRVIDKKSVTLLFNYQQRDKMRHKAQVYKVLID